MVFKSDYMNDGFPKQSCKKTLTPRNFLDFQQTIFLIAVTRTYQTFSIDTHIHFVWVTFGSINHFTGLFGVEVKTVSNTIQCTGLVMS